MLRRLRHHSFADTNRRVLGVITVAAVAAVVAAVFAVGSLGLLEDRYEMSGIFVDSAGLRSGDIVRNAGVDVGTVTAVEANFDRGHVLVRWEVDRDVHLGSETTAEISLATLLGGRYLRLAGPVTAPYLADLPSTQRQIPLARTAVPVTVEQVLNQTTRAIQDLDADAINTLLLQIADVAGDNAEDLEPLLQGITTIAATLNDRQAQIAALVADAEDVTATLAGRDAALAQLLDNASVLVDEISSRRDQLATLLGSGSEAVVSLSDLVTRNRTQLDAILGDLHATLEVVDPRLTELNEMLALAGPTFAQVTRTTGQGPWIDVIGTGLGPLDFANLLELVLGPLATGQTP